MQRRSLADIIMDKIREKEQGEARMAAGDDEDDDGMPPLPPKVGAWCQQSGDILEIRTPCRDFIPSGRGVVVDGGGDGDVGGCSGGDGDGSGVVVVDGGVIVVVDGI